MIKIKMLAKKFDNRSHYQSTMDLLYETDEFVLLHGLPKRKLDHFTRDCVFVFNEHSLEFFFYKEWFTVACVISLEGEIKSYYCNIAHPAVRKDDEVSFVDLDLDIVMGEEMIPEIVDWDDFEVNQKIYDYPKDLIDEIVVRTYDLKDRIEKRRFPFDGTIDEYIKEII